MGHEGWNSSGSWNLRPVTHKHRAWYRNLSELNEVTSAWVSELKIERPSHAMARGLPREAIQDLWMVDNMGPESNLDALLDDTSTEDLLERLERTVWSVQAWTLLHLIERTKAEERPALEAMLSQTAWKLGRKSAEARWQGLPAESRSDLRSLLFALNDSPFTGSHQKTVLEQFLITRAVATEIRLDLLACPHRLGYSELAPAADALCRIQADMIRGFVYGLNSRVGVEHVIAQPYCQQRWSLIS
jgi:hypothetical protein